MMSMMAEKKMAHGGCFASLKRPVLSQQHRTYSTQSSGGSPWELSHREEDSKKNRREILAHKGRIWEVVADDFTGKGSTMAIRGGEP
jgi:hypothetical protein